MSQVSLTPVFFNERASHASARPIRLQNLQAPNPTRPHPLHRPAYRAPSLDPLFRRVGYRVSAVLVPGGPLGLCLAAAWAAKRFHTAALSLQRVRRRALGGLGQLVVPKLNPLAYPVNRGFVAA